MASPTAFAVNQKAINRWTARLIPVVLIGIVSYVTWVMYVLVCVKYLLRPSPLLHTPRPRLAVAVIVLYSIFLILISVTYFRLIYTVITNPGYIPRGPGYYERHSKRKTRKVLNRASENEKHNDETAGRLSTNDVHDDLRNTGDTSNFAHPNGSINPRPSGRDEASPDLLEFYGKEVFVSEGDGRPIWCYYCYNWKPDRAHHCREVGRCVRKMDHFCPWVGGVIGETTFKFFIQFVAWAAVYCIFTLVVMAIFISELKQESKTLNTHWIVTTCLAALFGLFTFGMTGSSLQFAFLNTTTIENLTRRSKVWQLAIHMPTPPVPEAAIGFRTITYPLNGIATVQSTPAPKNFAILFTKPGENPWYISPYKNLKTVMGDHWYDFLLPLKYSPCCNHDRTDSQFMFGPVVWRMQEDAGITLSRSSNPEIRPIFKKKRRRSKRRQEKSRNHELA